MDDLISRAAAIEALSTPCDKRYRHGVWETCLDNIETAIRNIPAVDAAPVVRCRDCKYGKLCLDADGHRLIQCTNTKYPTANVETWPLELVWYCAGGERRDDDALSGR